MTLSDREDLFLNPLNWNQIKNCETNSEQNKFLSGKTIKAKHPYIFIFYLNVCVVKVNFNNFNNCAAEGFMPNSGTSW